MNKKIAFSLKNIHKERLHSFDETLRIQSNKSGFWMQTQNQRTFLDSLAIKFNIKEPKDWGNLSFEDAFQQGAGAFLKNYGFSLQKALRLSYPEVDWKRDWFNISPGFWQNTDNQRKFLEKLSYIFGIKKFSDWGKVPSTQVIKNGGRPLLKQYGYSLRRALFALYPGVNWKNEWFSTAHRNYWSDKRNQRSFFDHFAKLHEIKNAKEWGKITYHQIIAIPGSSFINKRYNGSLLNALQSVYPETQWKRSWFTNLSIFPKNHWNSMKNQRIFFDEISIMYKLRNPSDWKKVSLSLLKKKGGLGILQKYEGSIFAALKATYPELNWEQHANYFFINDFQSKPQLQISNLLFKFVL